MSKPRTPDSRQPGLFRVAFEKIIDHQYEVVLLVAKIDWKALLQPVMNQLKDG